MLANPRLPFPRVIVRVTVLVTSTHYSLDTSTGRAQPRPPSRRACSGTGPPINWSLP